MWRLPTELARPFVITLTAAVLLHACTAPVQEPPQTPVSEAPDLPQSRYLEALQEGMKLYRIDSRRSLITINVYRGGPLARLGHDHVVASRDVQGLVRMADRAPDPDRPIIIDATNQSRTDFRIPLTELSVDEPALRAAAGLTTTPSNNAKAGTRRNMQEKVLETSDWPWLTGHAIWLAGDLPEPTLDLDINLHGLSWRTKLAAEITHSGDELRIQSRLKLKQSDFGIEAFTALGGSLVVKDELDVTLDIIATAWRPGE